MPSETSATPNVSPITGECASDGCQVFSPKDLPASLPGPWPTPYQSLCESVRIHSKKTLLNFYDHELSYGQFKSEVELLAGFLQGAWALSPGERVVLFMHNCPQFMIAFYAVTLAGAIVVPVNPMLKESEFRRLVEDCGATVAIAADVLYDRVQPLHEAGTIRQCLLVHYKDYLVSHTRFEVPAFLREEHDIKTRATVVSWCSAIDRNLPHTAAEVSQSDLCVLPYTSGTTGVPKGCMHSYSTVGYSAEAGMQWFGTTHTDVILAAMPLFHLTGMQRGMNGPISAGCTIVLMSRWNRTNAGLAITGLGVTSWTAVPTMLIDFLAVPQIKNWDLSSVRRVSGGGSGMPESVAKQVLEVFGTPYVEGYGLTETIGPAHLNPLDRAKCACLGLPIFDTRTRLIDPSTLEPVKPGEVGEIAISGPQVFSGYWRNPEETRDAFIEHEGRAYFRTGDLARIDQDGYYFLVDRVKRMINVAGFKVWPAEVEQILYEHPAVDEAVVISKHDPRRGETVKALIKPKPGVQLTGLAEVLRERSKTRMAAYKVPSEVEIVTELPKSETGKILWRTLQEAELKVDGIPG